MSLAIGAYWLDKNAEVISFQMLDTGYSMLDARYLISDPWYREDAVLLGLHRREAI